MGSCPTTKAPPTVNPSLWRQSRLNMNHGLFEVVPGVYQVRGFDIANMTLIEGDTRRHRRRYADLDRRRARRDGAVFPASRQAARSPRSSSPTPIPTIGAARAACSTTTPGERQRARSSRPICSWNMRSRKTSSRGRRCCGARNISSGRCWPKARAARSIADWASRWRRVRSRCCGPPTSIMATGDKRDHRRAGVRIPDGAEQRSAGGNAFLHPALQAAEPGGELHA